MEPFHFLVNHNDVKSVVASLCVNKVCGRDSLSAEHLLCASPEIHTLKQRTLMLRTRLSSGLDLVNPGRARCLIVCEFPELS